MIWNLLKPIFFTQDPEQIHHFMVKLLKNVPHGLSRIPLPAYTYKPKTVWGLQFRNPVGLAAGFDKNGEILPILPYFGFGFAEIGTVTPLPQPGNPKPRLFRDSKNRALFNCMGFNNEGAQIVSRNLAKTRERGLLPDDFRIGVNIGKNKDTPLDQAYLDYKSAIESFQDLTDFVVINVSSPNTPGLRSLQTLESLKKISHAVHEVVLRWNRPPPILLKLAPELQGQELGDLISQMETFSVISGWILTNTLGGEWSRGVLSPRSGGWSGAPLAESSWESLKTVKPRTQKPVISVGGIMDAMEAKKRFEWGADLIEIYTGWIYQGPFFPGKIADIL